jgi:hypothetical protein
MIARRRSASRSTLRGLLARGGTLLVAVITVLLGPSAGAQQVTPAARADGGTPAWLTARLDNRLDARTRAAVERLIDSARAQGIPAEPLVDKALEGASKRAPAEVLLRAVRGLAIDLASARQLLGGQSLTDEVSAGAGALRAGVDANVLRSLREDRPGQPLVVALGVLTDLVARGVPAEAASRSVLALTKAGIADERLIAFRRDVERDIGIGAPPAAATILNANSAAAVLSRIPGQPGAGQPLGRPGDTRRRP